MFEDALASGLTASGADVYLLHVTPTPSVSYVVRTEPLPAARVAHKKRIGFSYNALAIYFSITTC